MHTRRIQQPTDELIVLSGFYICRIFVNFLCARRVCFALALVPFLLSAIRRYLCCFRDMCLSLLMSWQLWCFHILLFSFGLTHMQAYQRSQSECCFEFYSYSYRKIQSNSNCWNHSFFIACANSNYFNTISEQLKFQIWDLLPDNIITFLYCFHRVSRKYNPNFFLLSRQIRMDFLFEWTKSTTHTHIWSDCLKLINFGPDFAFNFLTHHNKFMISPVLKEHTRRAND